MKKLVVVLFLITAAFSFAQDRGLTVVAKDNLGQSVNIGKQYALFIAIDAYRNWPALKKPVADAREIRDTLRRDYYIDEVIELYNQQANRANITRTFTELQTKLGVHDSLFIYYAGHGHYDGNSDAGFWIPVDGGTDVFAQENWLPNSQIRGYISRLKTVHVFMVSDACFSGDILNTSRALPPQIDNTYYRRAYALTSRQVLTSGSSETVPDQSEFSSALLNCLRKNTAPLLDPVGIYNDVRLAVRKTTPLYGTLNAANHQEGATFLFFRRPSAAVQPATVQPAITPERTVSAAVGSITITSEIAGEILIDGTAVGSSIKAGGTVTVSNVSVGETEVAVRTADGKITRTPQPVMVRQGQTVSAAIRAPAQPAATQPNPEAAKASYDRGTTFYGRSEWDAAIKEFTEAIRLDPNYVNAYIYRGIAYVNKNDYDRAITDLNEAIRLNPNYAIAYYNRGNAYRKKNDNDRAIADYTQAIRHRPDYAWAYFNRGVAYYNKKDYDRAIADYTQAIRLDPNDADAYQNRGNAYKAKGDTARANVDYAKAKELGYK